MSYEHLLVKENKAEELKRKQPKLAVHHQSISCPDILKEKKYAHHYQQKHPRVMIELDKNDSVGKACYYCGTVYIYQRDK